MELIENKRRPVIVHEADAEVLAGQNPMVLLADSDDTDGVVSISSGSIAAGADNTKPHFHKVSWEVFYIRSGALEMMLEDQVVTVRTGGLIAIPPGVVHAFGATDDAPTEAVVFITPGVQRFDYFRMLPRILRGEVSEAELAAIPDKYDVHFVDNELWHRTRSAR